AAYSFAAAASPTLGVSPLDNLPAHRAEVWALARIRQRLGVLARLRYVGERTDQGESLAAYAALDVSGWATLRPTLRATWRIDNLLDARFMVRAGVTTPGRLIALVIDGSWE